MQKIKMVLGETIHNFTSEDFVKVSYEDVVSGKSFTVVGQIGEPALFGIYIINGKAVGTEDELSFIFDIDEVKSFEVLKEEKKIEENFETKKVAVLGLKDINGDYFIAPAFPNLNGASITKVNMEDFVLGNTIDVFPHRTFTVFSKFDYFQYDYCILEVEMETSSDDTESIYEFQNRRVKLVSEITKPWAYAEELINQLKARDNNHFKDIVSRMTIYHSKHKFNDDEELAVFFRLWRGRIELTRYNIHLLPKFLEQRPEEITVCTNGDAIYSFKEEELNETLQTLNKEQLIQFTRATDNEYLDRIDKSIMNKAFFEGLRKEHNGVLYELDYYSLLKYMSDATIEEYGADFLLDQCDRLISSLSADNDYEDISKRRDEFMSGIEEEGSDYDNYKSLNDCFESLVEAKKEVKTIKRLLKKATSESLDILRGYKYDLIKKHLNPEIHSLLEKEQSMVS